MATALSIVSLPPGPKCLARVTVEGSSVWTSFIMRSTIPRDLLPFLPPPRLPAPLALPRDILAIGILGMMAPYFLVARLIPPPDVELPWPRPVAGPAFIPTLASERPCLWLLVSLSGPAAPLGPTGTCTMMDLLGLTDITMMTATLDYTASSVVLSSTDFLRLTGDPSNYSMTTGLANSGIVNLRLCQCCLSSGF